MFYCEKCAERNNWPQSIMRSYGRCEDCGKTANCYDTPSRYLPIPMKGEEPKLWNTQK